MNTNYGNANVKGGSLIRLALYINHTVVGVHNALYNGQTQTRTANKSSLFILYTIESIENPI
jgi:hypothetical protein